MATLIGLTRAIALAALEKWATKEGDRDELAAGSSYDVSLTIDGLVDGQDFADACIGRLLVNHDSQQAHSTGPKPAVLVAALLADLPPRRRQQILDRLPDQYLAAGGRLEVDPDLLADAERMLERLRTSSTITRRGSVRFEPTNPFRPDSEQ